MRGSLCLPFGPNLVRECLNRKKLGSHRVVNGKHRTADGKEYNIIEIRSKHKFEVFKFIGFFSQNSCNSSDIWDYSGNGGQKRSL